MQRMHFIKGDITKQVTDAIVNAPNSSLLGGGGVDGAIHRAAGTALLNACVAVRDRQGGCKTGAAVITTAGNLQAKFVIHTVGPVWTGDKSEKEKLLADCYVNSLNLAVENDIRSISFPNISTGIYHFPKDKAAEIAVAAVTSFLDNNESIKDVVFVCFDDENYALYKALLS